ncbi:MAG: anti-sigma factor [Alphaproteobacteria bacterium]
MQRHSDEALVAYLDGELDTAEQRHVEAWLDADPEARNRMNALAHSADLVRGAYADIVDEPVPERLLAAARGETAGAAPSAEAEVVVLPRRRVVRPVFGRDRGRYIGFAAAAALFGIVIGGTGTYVGMGFLPKGNNTEQTQLTAAAAQRIWLDNAAASYKLALNAGDGMLVDVPASNNPREALQRISQNVPQVRLPDLKPWGLTLRGARLVAVDGKPAAQLVYVADDKALGAVTLVISAAKQPDLSPTIERRQDVNLLYWRNQGRAYALVGQADVGYLWGIANDIAWQLRAI